MPERLEPPAHKDLPDRRAPPVLRDPSVPLARLDLQGRKVRVDRRVQLAQQALKDHKDSLARWDLRGLPVKLDRPARLDQRDRKDRQVQRVC